MPRTPRSLFVTYEKSGDLLSDAKDKGASVNTQGWGLGVKRGKLRELTCAKELGTWPIKHNASLLEDALRPYLTLVRIKEPPFADFLTKEGAEDDSWTMRFWEIDRKKGWSRSITAGKENPRVWREIVPPLNRSGRDTQWAGVEFTHAKLHTRVMIHRWPIASIAPWGAAGSGYLEIKKRFVSFLEQII